MELLVTLLLLLLLNGDNLDLPIEKPGPEPQQTTKGPIISPVNPPSTELAKEPEKDPRDEPPPVIFGEEIDTEGGSIVFVLDRSGSMDEFIRPFKMGVDVWGNPIPLEEGPIPPTKLEAAKRELTKCIQSLPPNMMFNIYAFDCTVQRFNWQLQKADDGIKAAAITWLNTLNSGGNTGTGQCVSFSLFSHPECVSYVLLTDGEPTCEFDSYIHRRIINDNNRQRASITVFGIHAYGGHRQFCINVASDSGGTYIDIN